MNTVDEEMKEVTLKVNYFKFSELIKGLQNLILTFLNIYDITRVSSLCKEFKKFNYIDNFKPTAIRFLDDSILDNCDRHDRIFNLPLNFKRKMLQCLHTIEINFALDKIGFNTVNIYSLKLKKLIVNWNKQGCKRNYNVEKIFPNVEEFEECFSLVEGKGIKFRCAMDLINLRSLSKYQQYVVKYSNKDRFLCSADSTYDSAHVISELNLGDQVTPGINKEMKSITIPYMNFYLHDTINSFLRLFPNLEEIEDKISHWSRKMYVDVFDEINFTDWKIERNVMVTSKRKFDTISELKEFESTYPRFILHE
jgi:hypothetical protein